MLSSVRQNGVLNNIKLTSKCHKGIGITPHVFKLGVRFQTWNLIDARVRHARAQELVGRRRQLEVLARARERRHLEVLARTRERRQHLEVLARAQE